MNPYPRKRGAKRLSAKVVNQALTVERVRAMRSLARSEHSLDQLMTERDFLTFFALHDKIRRDAELIRGLSRALLMNGLLIAVTPPTSPKEVEMKARALLRQGASNVPEPVAKLYEWALTEDALAVGIDNVSLLLPLRAAKTSRPR